MISQGSQPIENLRISLFATPKHTPIPLQPGLNLLVFHRMTNLAISSIRALLHTSTGDEALPRPLANLYGERLTEIFK